MSDQFDPFEEIGSDYVPEPTPEVRSAPPPMHEIVAVLADACVIQGMPQDAGIKALLDWGPTLEDVRRAREWSMVMQDDGRTASERERAGQIFPELGPQAIFHHRRKVDDLLAALEVALGGQ